MALSRQRLVIGILLLVLVLVLVLAIAAVRAAAGGSDGGGYAPSSGSFEQGPAGYIGSDGSSSYSFDPSSGCTVLDGSVSC
jgi:hypothetical protein